LGRFSDDKFDIVLSSFAVGYAENLLKTFQEVFRVLRKNGLFVFAKVHPMVSRGRIIHSGKRRVWLAGSYFDRRRRMWTWRVEEGVARFYGRQRTIQDYFDALVEVGFVVERLLEPDPYPLERMNEVEKEKIPYAEAGLVRDYDIWRRLPYTIIFKARKPRV